jgi:outer membrane protein assembly complex protein YaeT
MPVRSGTSGPVLRRLLAGAAVALAAALSACVQGAGPSGPLPQYQQYEGKRVRSVKFEGDVKLRRDSLLAAIQTHPSTCKLLVLPICPFGVGRSVYKLDLTALQQDVARLQLYYRDKGYYGSHVVPIVDTAPRDEVRVRFVITPGDLVTTRSVKVTGLDSIFGVGDLEKRIPLKQGKPFSRRYFLASADTVRNALLGKGYAYAQVLRNYAIDTIADVADASFDAAHGPVVRIDTILFVGLDRLEEKIARRELTFREGDRLRTSALVQSQTNLYGMELISFASVEIAPDSLQRGGAEIDMDADTVRRSVLVRIVEAARYAADASVGFGTQDCLRGQITNVDRDFLGGARRLELTAGVSKLGAGNPVNLQNTLFCKGLRADQKASPLNERINTTLNYRLAANFLQPRLFGTRTSVVAGAHTERLSEVDLYLRRASGGQLGVVRRLRPRTVLTGTVTAENGHTEATDVLFCRAFERCEPQDIAQLRRPRWNNFATVSLVKDATRGIPTPTGGFRARTQVDYAAPLLFSDDRYLRLVGDGAIYRQVRPGWIASGRILVGSFLTGLLVGPQGYIPPEQRFYGGGATSVRGYGRNRLGPQVYIIAPKPGKPDTATARDTIAAPTGGTKTVVVQSELSVPSPFYAQYLRLAGFVDAGQVWDPLNKGAPSPGIRVTPGVGLRIATPVGPLRFDVAYNPYGPVPGQLYIADTDGHLVRALGGSRFRPTQRGGLRKLTFQIAVGTAF